MSPSETIQLQALKLKATLQGSFPSVIDAIIENPANAEAVKKQFRNVCALVSVAQFDALEELCNTLSMSKREVMNLALDEFLPRARAIVNAVDPFQDAEEIAKAIALSQSQEE